MSTKHRPVPSLVEDVPDSMGNKTIEETRKAVETMVRLGVDNHEALIRSAAGNVGVMEGGAPVPHYPTAPAPAPAQVQASHPQPQATPGKLIYGCGNVVQEGDIIMDQGTQMLAEVKTVAGNGIVLNVPAKGAQILQPTELLNYKRMGQK